MLPGLSLDASVRALGRHYQAAAQSASRLSSGLRIQRSGDDPAGLGFSESLRAQERGQAQAVANLQDGMHFLRIGLDGLTAVNDVLQRMREIAVQASNGTNTQQARDALTIEWGQNLNALADARAVAAQARLDFTLPAGQRVLTLQAGPNSGMTLVVSYENLRTAMVGAIATLTPLTPDMAGALTAVDASLTAVLNEEASLGADYNRIEAAIAFTMEAREKTAASGSLVRDADMAADVAALIKSTLLKDGATRITKMHMINRQSAARLLGV